MEALDFDDGLSTLEEELIPKAKARKLALGLSKGISDPRAKEVFSDDFLKGRFEKMTIESHGEWIPRIRNKPQSFAQYLNSGPNKLSEARKILYIMGLDENISDTFLENGRKYGEAFYYGLEVKILANIDVKELGVKSRGKGKGIQYSAKQILTKMKPKLPSDGYGMIGVLNKDIYSREDWLFVFGYASLKSRIGVFSFARYDPSFFGDDEGMTPEEVEDTVQFRGIKVMCHELGHMFGLKHCVYYKCIMNGSMSSDEALKKPGFLGPIGLRKVHHIVKFDLLERYDALREAGSISGHFDEVSRWYSDAIDFLTEVYERKSLKNPITPKYPKTLKKTTKKPLAPTKPTTKARTFGTSGGKVSKPTVSKKKSALSKTLHTIKEEK